jgi:mRNA interferase MazF
MPYCPDAGDFIWIDFDPQQGTGQRGRRPAFVLSPRNYGAASRLRVLCPITNRAKGYPFEVPIPPGQPVTGVILADQVKSQSWEERDAAFIATAPALVLAQAKGKIKALLQIR